MRTDVERRDCNSRRVGDGGDSGWDGECGASCAATCAWALCCEDGTALVYSTSSIIATKVKKGSGDKSSAKCDAKQRREQQDARGRQARAGGQAERKDERTGLAATAADVS